MDLLARIKADESLVSVGPRGTRYLWPMDAFIEHPVQQRKNVAKALRILMALDKEARKQTGVPATFLLLNASVGLQAAMIAAFPGRVINPKDIQGSDLLKDNQPDTVFKWLANTAHAIIAFGELPSPVLDILETVEHEGLLHNIKPTPLTKREHTLGLQQSDSPYGQYNGYKDALRPRHYNPTRGVQIREIVDYRPKYHI